MDGMLQDLRYAVRTLASARGFTLAVICTLALGIGAATAIFSVVNGVLLRPLPYPDPERVVRVWQLSDEGGRSNFSDANFADMKERARSFSGLAQVSSGVVPAEVNEELLRVHSAMVSADFMNVFGVVPVAGRGFAAEEQAEGAPAVALISSAYANRFFGGSVPALGESIRLSGTPHVIVGVMPAGFSFPAGADAWTPRERQRVLPSRTAHNWQVFGRVRSDVALAAATRELDAIARDLKAQHGDDTWMAGAMAVSLRDQLTGRIRPALLILLGAAGLLLLIACANVVNLLIARLATREREIAVRLALGAGQGRIVRQFLMESMVLALAGGALGTVIAVWGVDAILAIQPGNIPRLNEVSVNLPVLLFAFGVSMMVALALGLLTSRGARGNDLRSALAANQRGQSGNLSKNRTRAALVMAQVALTTVLLVGAGLLGRSFLSLLAVNPGFRTSGAVVMNLMLPQSSPAAEPDRRAALNDMLLERLRAIPGVEYAGGTNDMPLGGSYSSGTFLELQRPDEVLNFDDFSRLARDPSRAGYAAYRVASEDYFRAMEIPLLRGRGFERGDTPEGAHVALISETLARTRWPNEDPLGKLIQFGNMDGNLRALTIIGVVGDVREHGLDAEPESVLYGYSRQRISATGRFTWVMAGSSPPQATIAAAREAAREVYPDAPPSFRTMEELFAASTAERRFNIILLAVFAGTALLLALMGIYSVVAYLVSQRTREIGIRMALGARTGDVIRLVVTGGLALTVAGLAIGLASAVALMRLVTSLLFGVGPADPATFVLVALSLASAAFLASYIPARRAARVEPVEALRAE